MSSSCSVVPSSATPRRSRLPSIKPTAVHIKKWARRSNLLRLLSRHLAERNELLVQHLPLVQYIARSIHKRLPQHTPLEDLVSAGVLGLIQALDRFDPRKKIKFESYSKGRIRGAILDSLRELDWCPRTLRRKGREVERANQLLGHRLGRMPSEGELAAELKITLAHYQHLRSELQRVESLNLHLLDPAELSGPERGDGESAWDVPAGTEDPFSQCLRSEICRLLAQVTQELSTRRRQVLTLYYMEELTMKEVGARLNVGESRVSQLHAAALLQLRRRLAQLLEHQSRPIAEKRDSTEPPDGSWRRPRLGGVCAL